MSRTTGPQNRDESIVYALNIHGTFFENWCKEAITSEGGWAHVSSYEAVEFPPPTESGHRGKESHSDIRAQYGYQGCYLTSLIECKKHNPKYVKWVFFPKHSYNSSYHIGYPAIWGQYSDDPPRGWQTSFSVLPRKLFGDEMMINDEGRECRETYIKGNGNVFDTSTANANINDAAQQVAIATQCIYYRVLNSNEHRPAVTPGSGVRPNFKSFFLPMIVTTAELFICQHSASDVVPEKGEIPLDRVSLVAKNWLIYEYSLPCHLQHSKEQLARMFVERQYRVDPTRMHILIVQGQHLPTVLRALRQAATDNIWI